MAGLIFHKYYPWCNMPSVHMGFQVILSVGFGIHFIVSVSITIVFCNIFEMANFLHNVTDFEWWMMFLEMWNKCLPVHHIHVRNKILDCSLQGSSNDWKYWSLKENLWIYCSIWTTTDWRIMDIGSLIRKDIFNDDLKLHF